VLAKKDAGVGVGVSSANIEALRVEFAAIVEERRRRAARSER
jgi:hypothetical protein